MLFYEWGWYNKGLVLNKIYWSVDCIDQYNRLLCVYLWMKRNIFTTSDLARFLSNRWILWPEYLNTLNNSTLCQHYMFEILCLHFNILKAGGHSLKDNNTNLFDALNMLCMVVAIACSQERGGGKSWRGSSRVFDFANTHLCERGG